MENSAEQMMAEVRRSLGIEDRHDSGFPEGTEMWPFPNKAPSAGPKGKGTKASGKSSPKIRAPKRSGGGRHRKMPHNAGWGQIK